MPTRLRFHVRLPALVAMAVAGVLAAPALGLAAVELDRGRLLLSESPLPPPDDAPGWEPVVLPDEWNLERPDAEGYGWYRLPLPPLALPADEPLAVYLPELNLNAGVWVNGTPIGDCARLDEPVGFCWNRPLLLTIPPALLTGVGDHVDVRLFASRGIGGSSGHFGEDR